MVGPRPNSEQSLAAEQRPGRGARSDPQQRVRSKRPLGRRVGATLRRSGRRSVWRSGRRSWRRRGGHGGPTPTPGSGGGEGASCDDGHRPGDLKPANILLSADCKLKAPAAAARAR